MNVNEFSLQFDILYNNIMDNDAPGLDEYEKSVLLTKAQNEIVKNYYNPPGNKYKQGIGSTPKREMDFSNLTKSIVLHQLTEDEITDKYADFKRTDDRSLLFKLPTDIFVALNETMTITESDDTKRKIALIPINFADYIRIMSKPYKYPAKGQGWRLIFIGSDEQTNLSSPLGLLSEVILRNNTKPVDNSYMFRYIRFPRPIILTDLDGDLSIQGQTKAQTSELNAEIHDEILQRAVELAKAGYPDNATTALQIGQRSE